MLPEAEFDAQVERHTRINSAESERREELGGVQRGRSALERLARPAARQIARDMAEFDAILGDRGLRDGATEVLARLVKDLEVTGAERVPREGPLLIAANHPGLSDWSSP